MKLNYSCSSQHLKGDIVQNKKKKHQEFKISQQKIKDHFKFA
jgi:hypothetical protein